MGVWVWPGKKGGGEAVGVGRGWSGRCHTVQLCRFGSAVMYGALL